MVLSSGWFTMDLSGLSPEEALKALQTGPTGLSQEEAARRLAQVGPNSLQEIKGPSLPRRFLRQFTHFLAILLWLAAGLSFLAEGFQPGQGMATLGWAILGVILINALFTFVQEYKAERAVQALHRLLPATAWVLRSGQPEQIARHALVPGDLLLLEEGEQVPADARLVEVVAMRVDNSSLTGEAKPKRRTAEPAGAGNPLDAPNLVFAGTTILSGRGRAVVFATGANSEFGKIARLATTVSAGLSPLQKEIVRVTHVVALLATGMGALFFAIGLWMGMGLWVSSVFGIGIIVANVPEGLLPTVTLALAMGSQRMARRKALIKQLTSVETLGCATVICTDKTGTLTENRMRVERLYVDGNEIAVRDGRLVRQAEGEPGPAPDFRHWGSLFRAVALCNNVKRGRRGGVRVSVTGDPTEVALVEFAQHYGPLHGLGESCFTDRFRRMGELPFDADRKRMTTIHWVEGRLVAFVKGAPEVLLPLCSRTQVHGKTPPMAVEERETILARSRSFAHQAYRVLAVATRDIEAGIAEHLSSETVERDLTFLGLVALMDPPHREVPDAVARCQRAGIRVIMITGDHPLTALAVARLIGLVRSGAEGRVIEGVELDRLGDAALDRLLADSKAAGHEPVFARMAPRHKMRIVTALKEMGEVVAATGDGVNDAPALKKADIGIAMGVAGTDVAKESADMVLLNDNFASIVDAIEEGRAVYANIRKFVTYVLASNVPEIVPYLGYGIFAIPLPLTVPQILAVDLGTDMVPALALGAEKPHAGIMEAPPRPRTERLLSLPLLLRAYAFLGLIEAVIAMAAFFWFLLAQGWTWGAPLAWTDPLYRQATTVTLAAIVIAQVANVFACRSERGSVFGLGLLSNPFILWGIAVELALLALIVYTPIGNAIFGTGPLPAWVWPPLMLGSACLLLAEEIRKVLVRKWTANALRR
ncbi:MAG: cation-transporting P-type ATPase [Nitrospirota bacterium]